MRGFRSDAATAVVCTDKGKVRGYEADGLTVFKGIPYAKARRFHAPEEMEPWEGVKECLCFGFVCPLLNKDTPNGELKVPHRYWPMDENCQNLNLWTPGLDGAKRPVLVWLHGGGYEAGSAIEQEAYDGDQMAKYGDVVVVTVNHRLNILGYLDLSDFGPEYENSGNAGGDDIIAALRWVKKNIAAFGGDPDNVTVFGQSGGGAKVTTLLQSKDADGLYHRGINMSGVIGPILADCTGSGRDTVEALMGELGLTDVRELEEVDYHLLAKAYNKVKPALQAAGKNVGCKPFVNGHYKGDPVVHGFREETKDIPLLVGSVFAEFTGFTPVPYDRSGLSEEEMAGILRERIGAEGAQVLIKLFEEAYPERRIIDILQEDMIFRAPEIAYLKARSALNSATYAYLFNMDQDIDGGCAPWHCADIPFVFHNTDLAPYACSEDGIGLAKEIEEQVFSSVIAFARTGDPNNEKIPAWKPSTPEEEHTMVFDADTRERVNFDHELMAALQKYMGPVLAAMMQSMFADVQH